MTKDTIPTRTITPHKGGRTTKKSADVTPQTEARLREIKAKYGISLGDLIAWAVEHFQDKLINELKEQE